ncbi:hypothetical protein H0H93_004755, partial [Arthromyces matolae]
AHSDKLKERISQLNSTIAEKQVVYEQTKQEYENIVEANQKFYDYATKFRELYMKVDGLLEKKKRFETDLNDSKLNLQEIVEATDAELEERLHRFDEHISAQKQKKRAEDTKKQDLEDDLAN